MSELLYIAASFDKIILSLMLINNNNLFLSKGISFLKINLQVTLI